MKQLFTAFFLFNFLFFNQLAAQNPQGKAGYRIEVSIDGYPGDTVYLGYRRADKVYSKDTVGISKGKFVFEGAEPLPPGIFLVLLPPENKFFEFVVTKAEQRFSVSTKAPDFYKNLKFKGSKDNELLHTYQAFMTEQVEVSKKIQEAMTADTDEQQKPKLEAQMKEIAEGVRAYQNRLMAEHPGTYTARLVAAFQEPEIPEKPLQADGTPDETFPFRYYRAHYWDGFDVADEVWINTPYLKEKMDRYLDKLTVQNPDSIIAAVDVILQRAERQENSFKYCLPYLLNKYYTPEIMGLDAAYVHLADKYYSTGKASWTSEEQLKKITDDAYMMRNVLIGKPSPNVRVQRYDPEQHTFTSDLLSPYDLEAEYTVIFLWKPGCGHCKKMAEDLKSFYAEWQPKGVEIFSITSANHQDLEKALEDIQEKKMPWTITADPYQRARALQLYYGTSLPKLYILDKDKKIIANRVGVPQLSQIIQDHQQRNGGAAK